MKLRDYQYSDLQFYKSNNRCGNFSAPGTGKTAPTCVYIDFLWKSKAVKTIWAMPKSLMEKNRDELLIWSDLAPEEVVIVDGPPEKRKKLMASSAKCFIMGFDCFAKEWPFLIKLHPDIDCFVGDEWHLGFKSDGSQRTQSLYRFMYRTKYLVAMTGTIIDGRLDTAYPLIQLCAPGHYMGGHPGFLTAHAITNSFGKVVDWRNMGRVRQSLGKFSVQHSFEEVYGPEAKVIVNERVQMTSAQRMAYNRFEATALLELEKTQIDGSLPGANLIRCRQIMECPHILGAPLDRIHTTGKEDRLDIHLEDHLRTSKPLIIFSAHIEQHDRIVKQCEKKGFRVGMIDGRVSATQRARIDDDFKSGKIDIVVASAATAGVGFNWGHVDHIIFMSLDYMDSSFVQSYRRAIRGKRENPVLITVMEYENSVDQRVFEIVQKKSELAHKTGNPTEAIQLRSSESVDAQPTAAAEENSEKPRRYTMADIIAAHQR